MTSKAPTKIDIDRVRRRAARQGLALRKCPRRDPHAVDFGTYALLDGAQIVDAAGTSLEAIEGYLTAGRHRLAGKEVRRA